MSFRKLFICGLEKYQARYTWQLWDWTRIALEKRGTNFEFIEGDNLTNSTAIVTGQVLDAHGRSYYSMTQMAKVVKKMQSGEITGEDVIFFEDMFTPGIESLPYIINQVPENMRPKIAVRCLAQTIDPDDFVHVWGMSSWMGKYEQMLDSFVDYTLATNEEMVAHMKIAGWKSPIYNISGLSFGKDEVRGRVKEIRPLRERTNRVAYASRWDQEKNPNFFMDLIEYTYQNKLVIPEFAVFSGGAFRSNDQSLVDRARKLESEGKLKIYENLTKDNYYELLVDSKVNFNCAFQDWTSNVLQESDALGLNLLYPSYRSFPEMLRNDHKRMYVPWSIEDAFNKLQDALKNEQPGIGELSDWANGVIDRIVDILEGNGDQWNRSGSDYRNHLTKVKY